MLLKFIIYFFSKKIHRTASWNIYDRPIHKINSNGLNNNNLFFQPKQQCNLKRGRPLVQRDSNKSLNQTPKSEEDEHLSLFCSDETNARLNYLQEQLNVLISHTAEHTKGSFSDEDDVVATTTTANLKDDAPPHTPTIEPVTLMR